MQQRRHGEGEITVVHTHNAVAHQFHKNSAICQEKCEIRPQVKRNAASFSYSVFVENNRMTLSQNYFSIWVFLHYFCSVTTISEIDFQNWNRWTAHILGQGGMLLLFCELKHIIFKSSEFNHSKASLRLKWCTTVLNWKQKLSNLILESVKWLNI